LIFWCDGVGGTKARLIDNEQRRTQ